MPTRSNVKFLGEHNTKASASKRVAASDGKGQKRMMMTVVVVVVVVVVVMMMMVSFEHGGSHQEGE